MTTKHRAVNVVIFAGGVGARMTGSRIPKQFLTLGGRSVIAHTIAVFDSSPLVDRIVVVAPQNWIDYTTQILRSEHFGKICSIVPGGNSGQGSIRFGLEALKQLPGVVDTDIVLIHDGVRPLIDHATVESCLLSVKEHGATAIVSRSVETVIEQHHGRVTRVLNRESCMLARAPQGFILGDILCAHQRAMEDGLHNFVDSISLMWHYGCDVYIVEGPSENIKITRPEDYFVFRGYSDMREMKQLWAE